MTAPADTTSSDPDFEHRWWAFADAALRRVVAHHPIAGKPDTPLGSPLPTPDRADVEYELARHAFLEALDDANNGFAALVWNARLTVVETELLALVLAIVFDARRQAVLAHLRREVTNPSMTLHDVGLLLGGLERTTAAIGPGSGLRRSGLLDVAEDGPWARQHVLVPNALVWAFLGDGSPDPELPYGTRLVDLDDQAALESGDADTILVLAYGADRVRRRQAAMAELGGQRFIVAPQPTQDRAWQALIREATMTGRAIVIEMHTALDDDGRRWIERATHLALALTCSQEIPVDDLPDRAAIEVDAPHEELTDREWAAVFGDAARVHRLTPQQAERAARVYAARGHDIDAAVRRLLAGPLESLATRVRPRVSWDDLILSPSRLDQLRSITSRYRESAHVYDTWGFSATPSRGLVALFSGASGTGKTLAAEVLAAELGLDMFKLDLSSIVSKYIGETEKNLDQLFDAAGLGNVVLFFDEADALFGKRSEVSDARDRYANVEVSYLLQRVEAFDGVVVLATNFEKSIDDAFLRRIHARIDFVLPERAERRAIWARQLPTDALDDDVDIDWLAERFEFSGGQIRNAAVHAAFLAAESGTLIGMEHLVSGAAQEFRKAGRLLRPEVFGDWYSIVTPE